MRKSLLLSGAILACALATPAFAETSGPQHFNASKLTIHDVIGEVKVSVDPSAKDIAVTIDATEREFPLLSAKIQDGGVLVARTKPAEKEKRDWKLKDNDVVITIVLPKGTPVHIDDMIGKFDAGDLDAPLTAKIKAAVDLHTGQLHSADIDVAGAADIETGDIAGSLKLAIAGAGNVDIGTVRQGTDIRITGFGDVDVAGVRGPVSVRVSGVGDVSLKGGDADRLDVSVSGMGAVSFEGEAKERHIDSSGLASVKINGKKV